MRPFFNSLRQDAAKWWSAFGRTLVTDRRARASRSFPVPENWHEDFIVLLASLLRPRCYVELGLYQCVVFNRIIPFAELLVGIDIDARAVTFMDQSTSKTRFFHGPTTQFAQTLRENPIHIELLFIDADHSREAVLADFHNLFPFVVDHGLIVIHDSYPKDRTFSAPELCGTGYQAIAELSRRADIYEMVTIPVHPGLSICRKRIRHLRWQSGAP